MNHKGYPILNANGTLDKLVCLYPKCGKKFSHRDLLFRHLNRVIEKDRMIHSYHANHFRLTVKNKNVQTCEACKESFQTLELIQAHYCQMGVKFPQKKQQPQPKPPQQNPNSNSNSSARLDPYEDPNSCVVCMDAERRVVFIPCGHLVCCRDCGILQKKCPICRADLQESITVFHA